MVGKQTLIGLNDMAIEQDMVWLDGNPATYRNFKDTEPNGNPGDGDVVRIKNVNNNYKWYDGDSAGQYPFLCSREPRVTTGTFSIRFTVSSYRCS